MDFKAIAATLKDVGYSPRKADAKIAHDIVLKAIEDAGFHDKVTIKGGVVRFAMDLPWGTTPWMVPCSRLPQARILWYNIPNRIPESRGGL